MSTMGHQITLYGESRAEPKSTITPTMWPGSAASMELPQLLPMPVSS